MDDHRVEVDLANRRISGDDPADFDDQLRQRRDIKRRGAAIAAQKRRLLQLQQTFMHRRLVVEIGRRDTPGRPVVFGTTFTFLERFGLTSLDDLPPLSSDAAQLAALTEPPPAPADAAPVETEPDGA